MKVNIGKYKKSGERNIKVHIDPYDTWNMDSTLSHIILPMLIQVRETKHGSPVIDDEDVPHLPEQGTSSNEGIQHDMFASDEQNELFWKQYSDRWEWVLDEMIFAFRSSVEDNWGEKYFTGESDVYWEELDDGSGMIEMKKGPEDTFVWNKVGYFEESDRIKNGFRLFGKYYQGLWS
jgi:hypothetical protein